MLESGKQIEVGRKVRLHEIWCFPGLDLDTDGDNRVVTSAYDNADRLLSVTDPVSRQTRFTYDAAGQTLIETRAYGTLIQEDYATYTYSANGKQATVKDANTNQTNFDYDGFDRLSKTTFPDTTYEQLTYDADGDVLTRRNRSNQTLTFTYDNLDRMLTKVSPSPALTTTWSYDGAGRIDKMCDATSCATTGNIIDYSYDTAGRLTSTATTIAGLSGGAKTVTYTLDAAGNRTSLAWPETGSSAYSVTYTYDTLNRMATAAKGGTTLATYTYNPLSQRTNLAYNGSAGATVAYTWTTADDLLTLTHNLLLTTNDVTYTETYTNAHQLATETISDTDYRFAPGANGTSAYASANNLNQYPSVTPAGGSAQTLTYDTRGNLTGDGTWTYAYDAENRMLTANKTGTSATFVYDPLGRRVKKQVGTARNWYVSDGADEIAEYTGVTAATLAYRYVPGPAIDQPIAMVTSAGVRTFFHTDKRGSVIATTDSSGNLSEGLFTYDACGNMSGVATGEPFRYVGRRYDSETGLLYNRARYLSNALCRFLQTDPVGYTSDMNSYTYGGNDPIDHTDPFGLASTCDASRINTAPGSVCANSNKDPTLSGSAASNTIQKKMQGASSAQVSGQGRSDNRTTSLATLSSLTAPQAAALIRELGWKGKALVALTGITMLCEADPSTCAQIYQSIKAWAANTFGNKVYMASGPKPKDVPAGTKPIDQAGLGREEIHRIKKGIGAGPKDWVGIDPDGHVIVDDGTGHAEDAGHKDDYLP